MPSVSTSVSGCNWRYFGKRVDDMTREELLALVKRLLPIADEAQRERASGARAAQEVEAFKARHGMAE